MKRFISAVIVCAFTVAPALADSYPFSMITSSAVVDQSGNPIDTSSWFSLEISEATGGGVNFKFLNNAPAPSEPGYLSAITEVFFYDGALIGDSIGSLAGSGPLVSFDVVPAQPGAQLPGFVGLGTKAYAAADADTPATKGLLGYGIHSGEWLEVIFENVELNAVLASLDLSGSNQKIEGALQIGIHVQALPGYDKDGNWKPDTISNSYIITPVPGAVLLGFLGLGYAGMRLRREV